MKSVIEALIMSEEGSKYTAEEIFVELNLFLTGGTDTTSHFFEMLVYLIYTHPEI